MSRLEPYWSTKDELRYLKRIGHHFTVGSQREGDVQPLSRLELLKRYKEIMQKRTNWGGMDPWAILLHVNVEIGKEKHHGKA